MTEWIGRLVVPAGLALLIIWRAIAIGDHALGSSSGARRRPPDLAIKSDVAAAMTLPWKRPIFSRPAAATSPAGTANGPSTDAHAQAIRLVGVVAEGDRRLALLSLDGRLVRSAPGASIGEWTVQSIDVRSVTLAKNLESQILRLDQKSLSK